MRPLIDIDDATTWPPHIYRIVSTWAAEFAGKTSYTNDLPLRIELEARFRDQLAGYRLRAYHYTRLLPHERAMIFDQGLRMLSADLLEQRIDAAQAVGVISTAEAECFHKGHVFATGEQEHREGQVCLVLSELRYERDPGACLPLLKSWGGEGLYCSSRSVPFRARLESLGSPTRVTAQIDFADRKHAVYPSLHKVFVGSLLRLHDVGADVFYRASIPPEHVQRIDEVLLLTP
jgi:hypothetical protein